MSRTRFITRTTILIPLILVMWAAWPGNGLRLWAQEGSATTSQESQPNTPSNETDIDETATKVKEKIGEIGDTINQSEQAQELSQSILDPIYQLAEYVAFPAFYWVAFALMVAGVVSYAGQLVLTKFFLLFKFSLNFKEILGDLLSLVISALGLVLTTQAATENSTFTQSPVAVISSALVGVVVGILFYIWGQSQEFKAVEGSRGKRKTEQ